MSEPTIDDLVYDCGTQLASLQDAARGKRWEALQDAAAQLMIAAEEVLIAADALVGAETARLGQS